MRPTRTSSPTLTNVLTTLQHTEKALLRRWCLFDKIQCTYPRRAANVSKLPQHASSHCPKSWCNFREPLLHTYAYLIFRLETRAHTHTGFVPQETTCAPGKKAKEFRRSIPSFCDRRGRYGRSSCDRRDHASAVNPAEELSVGAYSQ